MVRIRDTLYTYLGMISNKACIFPDNTWDLDIVYQGIRHTYKDRQVDLVLFDLRDSFSLAMASYH